MSRINTTLVDLPPAEDGTVETITAMALVDRYAAALEEIAALKTVIANGRLNQTPVFTYNDVTVYRVRATEDTVYSNVFSCLPGMEDDDATTSFYLPDDFDVDTDVMQESTRIRNEGGPWWEPILRHAIDTDQLTPDDARHMRFANGPRWEPVPRTQPTGQ